jgi:hypothetical protein
MGGARRGRQGLAARAEAGVIAPRSSKDTGNGPTRRAALDDVFVTGHGGGTLVPFFIECWPIFPTDAPPVSSSTRSTPKRRKSRGSGRCWALDVKVAVTRPPPRASSPCRHPARSDELAGP